MTSGEDLIATCVETLAVYFAGLFVAGAVLSCGGPAWTAADTKSATDAARVELAAQRACAEDDGGCRPALVRSLQRAAFCNTASMLVRHGADAPDGGIACRPQ
jgi:hypothetical protein